MKNELPLLGFAKHVLIPRYWFYTYAYLSDNDTNDFCVNTKYAKNVSVCERLLKEEYETHAFATISQVENCWKKQILYMDDYWNEIHKIIRNTDFYGDFCQSCYEHGYGVYVFNFEKAYRCILGRWRVDLMTNVANRIFCWYTDHVRNGTDVVCWNYNTRQFKVDDAYAQYIQM